MHFIELSMTYLLSLLVFVASKNFIMSEVLGVILRYRVFRKVLNNSKTLSQNH